MALALSFKIVTGVGKAGTMGTAPPLIFGAGPNSRMFGVSSASVVQRAEIECGGVTARHALGRFALNLGRIVNFDNLLN